MVTAGNLVWNATESTPRFTAQASIADYVLFRMQRTEAEVAKAEPEKQLSKPAYNPPRNVSESGYLSTRYCGIIAVLFCKIST